MYTSYRNYGKVNKTLIIKRQEAVTSASIASLVAKLIDWKHCYNSEFLSGCVKTLELHFSICLSQVRQRKKTGASCILMFTCCTIENNLLLTSTGQRQSSGFPDFWSAGVDSFRGGGATTFPASVNLKEQRRLVTSIQHDRWATPNYYTPALSLSVAIIQVIKLNVVQCRRSWVSKKKNYVSCLLKIHNWSLLTKNMCCEGSLPSVF